VFLIDVIIPHWNTIYKFLNKLIKYIQRYCKTLTGESAKHFCQEFLLMLIYLQLDNISSYKEDNNNIYYFLDTINDNIKLNVLRLSQPNKEKLK